MIFDPLQKNNVTVTGAAQGKGTIIFAHGFGTDLTAWEEIAKAFKEEYKIVLFDNVGGGKADPHAFSPIRYSSLEAYAEDLLDICEALEIEDAYFVGHSVSSMIGLLAAIKIPDYFKKMVFIGGSPRYLNDQGYFGGFEQGDLDQLFEAMKKNYYAWASGFAPLVMGNSDNPQLAERYAATISAIRPDIGLEVLRVIFHSDYRRELGKLQTPSLIIQSQQDIAVPREVALYLRDHLPNSQLSEIEAEGHLPHISKPEEVIKSIKAFVEQ